MRGRRAHPSETEEHAGCGAGIRAAREKDISVAVPDHARGIADGIRRAGAACRQHMAGAAEAERDGDLARHDADDRHRNRIRRDAVVVARVVIAILAFGDVDTARAAADDDADVGGGRIEAGIEHGLARRKHGNPRDLCRAPEIGARVSIRPGSPAADSASTIAASGTWADTRDAR